MEALTQPVLLVPSLQSPVWLLFLDCVYQVGLQHPAALEFTSDYLVALWHAAYCSLHSSFMFDSINAKFSASAVSITSFFVYGVAVSFIGWRWKYLGLDNRNRFK